MIGAAPPTLEIVFPPKSGVEVPWSAHRFGGHTNACLLYTSDAADE